MQRQSAETWGAPQGPVLRTGAARDVVEARIGARWRASYRAAETGIAIDERDARLGGRWVPSAFAWSLFPHGRPQSRCAPASCAASPSVTRPYGATRSTGCRHPPPVPSSLIAAAGVRQGFRTAGRYDPKAGRIDITTGPLDGRSFKSPSSAARAVVGHYKPAVNPHRNGWSFWSLDDGSKRLLQSIRPQKGE